MARTERETRKLRKGFWATIYRSGNPPSVVVEALTAIDRALFDPGMSDTERIQYLRFQHKFIAEQK